MIPVSVLRKVQWKPGDYRRPPPCGMSHCIASATWRARLGTPAHRGPIIMLCLSCLKLAYSKEYILTWVEHQPAGEAGFFFRTPKGLRRVLAALPMPSDVSV